MSSTGENSRRFALRNNKKKQKGTAYSSNKMTKCETYCCKDTVYIVIINNRPILTIRTITTHLILLQNTKKATIYGDGNPGTGLVWEKPTNGLFILTKQYICIKYMICKASFQPEMKNV